MAAQAEIVILLKTLADAYPGQRIAKPTYQVYLDHLADIPAWLLERAVQRCIETSAWFPKISELRQAAAQIANTHNFTALELAPIDYLAIEAQALEDVFYDQAHLDPAEWEYLAAMFDRQDRPHRAAHARDKLRGLQWIRDHQAPV